MKKKANKSLPLEKRPFIMECAEVAEILNCTDTHVQGLIASGQLKAFDISAKNSDRAMWRIPKHSVMEFLAARKVA